MSQHGLDRGGPVMGRIDDIDILGRSENRSQMGANHGFVINHQYFYDFMTHGSSLSTGRFHRQYGFDAETAVGAGP